jgi:hypothetical protein
MREIVETATRAPCLFLQGASGDLGPVFGYVGDTTVADQNGRQLGHAVMSALESMPPPGVRLEYEGIVVSGANIGVWRRSAIGPDALRSRAAWGRKRLVCELPYRGGLPDREACLATLAQWRGEEARADAAGDAGSARECRARAERVQRELLRVENLPAGRAFPLPITILRTGDVIWIALEGEHYQELQLALRRKFAGTPVVVATLANGSRCAYLPSASAYGKGIYQESIAVLAQGCLERVIERLEQEVALVLAAR